MFAVSSQSERTREKAETSTQFVHDNCVFGWTTDSADGHEGSATPLLMPSSDSADSPAAPSSYTNDSPRSATSPFAFITSDDGEPSSERYHSQLGLSSSPQLRIMSHLSPPKESGPLSQDLSKEQSQTYATESGQPAFLTPPPSALSAPSAPSDNQSHPFTKQFYAIPRSSMSTDGDKSDREVLITCATCYASTTWFWRLDLNGRPLCKSCSRDQAVGYHNTELPSQPRPAKALENHEGQLDQTLVKPPLVTCEQRLETSSTGVVKRSSAHAARLSTFKMRAITACDACRRLKARCQTVDGQDICFTCSTRRILCTRSGKVVDPRINKKLVARLPPAVLHWQHQREQPGPKEQIPTANPSAWNSAKRVSSVNGLFKQCEDEHPDRRTTTSQAACLKANGSQQNAWSDDEVNQSTGEVSSSEDELESTRRKRELVDNVMKYFVGWLDQKLGVVSRPSGNSTTAATPSQPATSPELGSALSFPGRNQQRADRKKRRLDGDESDDDSRSSPAKKLKDDKDDVDAVKFACPYFKHNPRKYKHQRPCCGPGWNFVHRIKEHLYRKHALPKFTCHRCCRPFDVEEDLQAHARAAVPCEIREPEAFDGFNQDQEKRLRSRKKTAGEDLTEPEKWRQMYRILFPDVREEEIPSPYYDTASDKAADLQGYEDYLRRELPPMVRRRLEHEVEREFNFMEEGLKRRVVDIVRNLQLTLFRSYQRLDALDIALAPIAELPAAPPPSMPLAVAFPTPVSSSSSLPTPEGGAGMGAADVQAEMREADTAAALREQVPDLLEDGDCNFWGDDEFDFSQWVDVDDAATVDFSAKVSDSGYSTNGAEQERIGRGRPHYM